MEAALKVQQEKLEEASSAETIVTSLMNARNNSLKSECHKLHEMEKQLAEVSDISYRFHAFYTSANKH